MQGFNEINSTLSAILETPTQNRSDEQGSFDFLDELLSPAPPANPIPRPQKTVKRKPQVQRQSEPAKKQKEKNVRNF